MMACQKENLPTEEGRDCIVTINTVGEISTSEEDLTRASASLNDLYAVQVYKDGSRFAMGIFDDVSKMQLNLKTGSTYDVRMCMVKDAKSYLKDYFSLTNNGLKCTTHYNLTSNSYTGPFRIFYQSGDSSFYLRTNAFFYNSNVYYQYYSSASSTSYNTQSDSRFELECIRNGYLLKVQYPTCTDWFYGEVNKFAPNGEATTMNMELKRVGFGLKYELSGVTDGEVTVKVYNSTRTFIDNTTNTSSYASDEQFITFYDTYSAWQYADNYTENMTVSVVWKRGIGVTQDLGTKTIQVKRNCLNNIRIKLSSDDKGAGLLLQTEDEGSMGATDTTIPVA